MLGERVEPLDRGPARPGEPLMELRQMQIGAVVEQR
jgi:hypothetical protein